MMIEWKSVRCATNYINTMLRPRTSNLSTPLFLSLDCGCTLSDIGMQGYLDDRCDQAAKTYANMVWATHKEGT